MINNFLKRINKKTTRICVIGLGYVGLPLCISFLKAKFTVYGLDKDKKKISVLKNKKSYISTVNDHLIKNNFKNFFPSNNFSIIKNSEIIIVCVPTPIKKNKKPNLKYVEDAVFQIKKYLKKNQIIIFECTSYPGTTEHYFFTIFCISRDNLGNIFLDN